MKEAFRRDAILGVRVPVSSPADAMNGVPMGLRGYDLFRLGFADPPSPKGEGRGYDLSVSIKGC